MPTENKIAEPAPSLATGHYLDAATWADFVQRLRYDCKGKRVHDHCTADAIFIVEARRIVSGLDMDYTDKRLVYWDSGESVRTIEGVQSERANNYLPRPGVRG